jgi:hypothetical protein
VALPNIDCSCCPPHLDPAASASWSHTTYICSLNNIELSRLKQGSFQQSHNGSHPSRTASRRAQIHRGARARGPSIPHRVLDLEECACDGQYHLPGLSLTDLMRLPVASGTACLAPPVWFCLSKVVSGPNANFPALLRYAAHMKMIYISLRLKRHNATGQQDSHHS